MYISIYIYTYIHILLYNLEFRVCSKDGFGSRGKQLEVSKDSFLRHLVGMGSGSRSGYTAPLPCGLAFHLGLRAGDTPS